ncbi:hypothetical protein [Pleionea sp. CnH1-48]|uniref:hypothetical protein n=1 Tax=Pleionea sp. CnH1-48 TaxID=2954494 RepID=UPI002097CC12|nr:hypothetical protein [Pleionea sp. CnH1-48]MCO7222959.1 hypothetical protein [Pleionea sp. CnH1-48]
MQISINPQTFTRENLNELAKVQDEHQIRGRSSRNPFSNNTTVLFSRDKIDRKDVKKQGQSSIGTSFQKRQETFDKARTDLKSSLIKLCNHNSTKESKINTLFSNILQTKDNTYGTEHTGIVKGSHIKQAKDIIDGLDEPEISQLNSVSLEDEPQEQPQEVERLLPGLTVPKPNHEAWNYGKDEEGERRYNEISRIVRQLEGLKTYQNDNCEFQENSDYEYKPKTGGVSSDYHSAGHQKRKEIFLQAKAAGYDLSNKEVCKRLDNIVSAVVSSEYESFMTSRQTFLR